MGGSLQCPKCFLKDISAPTVSEGCIKTLHLTGLNLHLPSGGYSSCSYFEHELPARPLIFSSHGQSVA